MVVKIRFLGTAAFEIITADSKRLLIDPYLDENPVSPIKVADIDHLDLLLVTHAAYDHLGDTLQILKRFPELILVCGGDVRGYLMRMGVEGDRIRAIPWGMMIKEKGVPIRPVESHHWSYIESPNGISFSSTPIGFIVYAGEEARVYHSGDTSIFSDLKLIGEFYRPNIGLINVGVPEAHRGAEHGVPEYLTGEMTPYEAATACQWLRLKYAIPCHHDDPQMPQVTQFARLLETMTTDNISQITPVLLHPGETFVWPSGRLEPAEKQHREPRNRRTQWII